MTEKTRVYKFDNVKFFCMILVVAGHFLEEYVDYYNSFLTAFLIIYSFHMTTFIFISGLFTKKMDKATPFNTQKFFYYIVLGYLLKLFTYIIKIIAGKNPVFEWFGGNRIPWFMFALAAFYGITYLIRKLPSWACLIGSLILAGAAGYFNFINDTLWASRIIVFLPVYLAGYYLTPEKVIEFTSKLYVKIPAIVLSLGYIGLCIFRLNQMYPLRNLFGGRIPYSGIRISGCSCLHRYLCYIISAVLVVAFIAIMPKKKIPVISHMGANTLGVFFWHRLLMYVMTYAGFFTWLRTSVVSPLWQILFILLIIAVTMLLSLDLFSKPLNLLKRGVYKLKTGWCLGVLCIIIAVGLVDTFVL